MGGVHYVTYAQKCGCLMSVDYDACGKENAVLKEAIKNLDLKTIDSIVKPGTKLRAIRAARPHPGSFPIEFLPGEETSVASYSISAREFDGSVVILLNNKKPAAGRWLYYKLEDFELVGMQSCNCDSSELGKHCIGCEDDCQCDEAPADWTPEELKKANSDGRPNCAQCGDELTEVMGAINSYRYCKRCE